MSSIFRNNKIVFLLFSITLFFSGIHLNIFIQDCIKSDMNISNVFSLISGILISFTFGILYIRNKKRNRNKKL